VKAVVDPHRDLAILGATVLDGEGSSAAVLHSTVHTTRCPDAHRNSPLPSATFYIDVCALEGGRPIRSPWFRSLKVHKFPFPPLPSIYSTCL
jgi:hypothetical protein